MACPVREHLSVLPAPLTEAGDHVQCHQDDDKAGEAVNSNKNGDCHEKGSGEPCQKISEHLICHDGRIDGFADRRANGCKSNGSKADQGLAHKGRDGSSAAVFRPVEGTHEENNGLKTNAHQSKKSKKRRSVNAENGEDER